MAKRIENVCEYVEDLFREGKTAEQFVKKALVTARPAMAGEEIITLVKDKETREPLVPFGKDPNGYMKKIIGMLVAEGFWTYSHENMIIVAPPLIITEDEIVENMKIMDKVLTEVDKWI